MRVLSLFSGIGAHDLGLEWAGYKIVAQVEIDEYCQKVLEKHWPKVPKWRDITSVTATNIRRRCGRIDLITGGFPCQDISTAGKQAGLIEGDRSSLYWEMWRLIRELRPDWLLLENVPALRTKGADNVLASLEALGYTLWPLVVGAVHAGAPHERKRVWIVGYLQSKRTGKRNNKANAKPISEQTRAISGSPSNSVEYAGIIPDTISDTIRQQSRRGSGATRQSPSFAFPARPGEQQYDWEEPRTIESTLGTSASRFAQRLAGYRGIVNAADKISTFEELLTLWQTLRKEPFQRKVGRLHQISKEEILFYCLCQSVSLFQPNTEDERCVSSASTETFESCLRKLWERSEIGSSSHRPGPNQQQSFKSSNIVQTLSRQLARESEKAWISCSWEETAHFIKERRRTKDQLKALGNANPPAIPYLIGLAILEAENERRRTSAD